MTCSVILRPPEGVDLASAAATLAEELDPIVAALPWACERFHLGDPWLEDGAIEVHTKVFAGSQDPGLVARDTRQCAALGALISIRRPDWAVEISDDGGLVQRELGVDEVALRGGRLVTGAEVLGDLLTELDDLARHIQGQPTAARIESLDDEDGDGIGPLWTWQATDIAGAPAVAALDVEQDGPDSDSAWTRIQLRFVAPPRPAWRIELLCLPLAEDARPLGQAVASLGQVPAGAHCSEQATGFVDRGEIVGVAVFIDELHLRPVHNGHAPVQWATDDQGERWLTAHVPVRNDGAMARLVTRITWLDRDGDPVEVEETLQDETIPPGDSLVQVQEPRLAWQDEDQRLATGARLEILAADLQRHCLGVAWRGGRWTPLPGLHPGPLG